MPKFNSGTKVEIVKGQYKGTKGTVLTSTYGSYKVKTIHGIVYVKENDLK